MKLYLLLFHVVLLAPYFSYSQMGGSPVYDESNYVKVSRDLGPEATDEPLTVWYRCTQDTSFSLKKVYLDSANLHLVEKMFYKANQPEGPFYGYWNDTLIVQGNYKAGKLNGERLSYESSKLVQRSFFADGLNSGTWEMYDETGKAIRRITYNNKGQVSSDVEIE